jgi:alpha-ketoglutarate-dependent taurine dioxygenase
MIDRTADVRSKWNGRRQAVAIGREELVTAGTIGASALPLVIRPVIDSFDLSAWAAVRLPYLESLLLKYGAILFRGFGISGIEAFQHFVDVVSGAPLAYHERSSPRSEVGDRIYTSTDYPAERSIFPHNEHSYAIEFPRKLFFYCETAATRGGETPIGDTRRVLARIDAGVRRKFEEKGWMYVRNFGGKLGLSWQAAFQTSDRKAVEEYCAKAQIEWEWKNGDRLRTQQVRPSVISHPVSGEAAWFNHATFFHVTTLEPDIRDELLKSYAIEDLPNHTYYGDGSPIEPDTLQHLRDAYVREMVSVPWEQSDILLIDNILTAHARNSFEEPRRILFAMAEPIRYRPAKAGGV